MLLVTGAGGFVGSHVARYFAARGEPLALLELQPSAALPSGGASSSSLHFVDVCDPDALHRCVSQVRPRAIVHAAALLPNASPEALQRTNVEGTLNVLSAARAAGVPRVVCFSSSAVYAAAMCEPQHEGAPLLGEGAYAESKKAAEASCLDASSDELCVSVLRLVPTVGPGRLGLFALLFEWVREGRRIPLVGRGGNRHQLVDVEDVCTAVELVLSAPAARAQGVFNVGAGVYGTVRADLEALCAAAGTGARTWPVSAALVQTALRTLHALGLSPIHTRVFESARHDAHVATERLRALGWTPRHGNVDALVRAYRWYVAQPPRALRVGDPGHGSVWPSRALSLGKHLF